MVRSASLESVENSQDRVLAQLVNDALEALQEGRPVDIETLAAQWPAHADELRRLLQVMQTCAQVSGGEAAGIEGAGTAGAGAEDTQPKALGDFVIQRELGRGGMGIVYEAQQLSLRRHVALKVLPFAAVLDRRQLQRFRNEAQAAALLHHPHIVPVYGVGCERGVHYYAMQLIAGPTVGEVIQHLRSHARLGPPPLVPGLMLPGAAAGSAHHAAEEPHAARAPNNRAATRSADPPSPPVTTVTHGILSASRSHRSSSFIRAAVQLGIEVAEALDYAHREGVVHRDIKPGNLLLDEHGKVWVTDFGLARIEADPGMTLTGDLLGTLRYMSPEQALANRATIDGRTDVYSLGATLYELLTLEPVYQGDDKQTLLRQIAFDDPRPPRQLERGLPFELETILLKALAKNPNDRYATAGALADDLRRFLEQKPILARRPTMTDRATKWALRNRRLVVVGATGLLLTVLTLTVASLLIWNEQHKTQHALDTAVAERTNAEREGQRAAALAANFRRHLYISNIRLIQQYADHGQRRELTEQLNEVRDAVHVDDIPTFAWHYWWHQCRDDPLFVLPGQQQFANAVLFSADGRRLATAGTDGVVRLWDVATGRVLQELRGAAGGLHVVAVSPDGRWLTSAGGSCRVYVWDIPNGRIVHDLAGHEHPVRGLHFLPDGHTLISTDRNNIARSWDLKSGRGIPANPIHTPAIARYAWSSDGRWVATAGADGRIRVMDRERDTSQSESVQGDLPVPNVLTVALRYMPDDQRLIWVGADGQIRVIDVTSQQVLFRGQLPVCYVVCADLDVNCLTIVTVDEDQQAQVWEIHSARSLARIDGVNAETCRFSDDGQTVAMIGPEGFVALWQPFVRAPVNPPGHACEVWSVAFSPDGRWLASGSDDHTVRIWKTLDGSEFRTLQGHTATVTGVAFSPDGHTLASGSLDGLVKLWQVDGGQEIRTLQGHEKRVCCLTFSPDGSLLASGGDKAIVWDVRTFQEATAFRAHESQRINAVRFSPDGSVLAVASNSGHVLLVASRDWQVFRTLEHDDEVWAVDFSPDGRTLATGDKSGNLRVWSIAAGQPLAVRRGHLGYVRAVRFTRDGRTLASGGDDHRIRLWDPVEVTEICSLDGHADGIYTLAFSPDDGVLASGSYDGAIRFWHAERSD